jgi:hypothetical protein
MRTAMITGLGAAALALAASAKPAPTPPQKPAAPSAERAGAPASYRTQPGERGHGYSARGRRMLDCLASDPRYDPGADRIRVGPDRSRPCEVDARS